MSPISAGDERNCLAFIRVWERYGVGTVSGLECASDD